LKNDINVAFWNLGNLFDVQPNEISSDLEFTPNKGWNEKVRDIKIQNLTNIIKTTFDNGPDLIGVCEIENVFLAKKLIDELKKLLGRDDYQIAGTNIDGKLKPYHKGPDLRGIDTCLIYSNKIFEQIDGRGYMINFRFPTRDIFYAKLRVLKNNTKLNVLVNHWPSRRGRDDYSELMDTEYSRYMTAEHCGKIVDSMLKYPKMEIEKFPNNFYSTHEGKTVLEKLEERWNINILVMGDFNDEPFDKSIMKYLYATPDKNLLRKWKRIFRLAKEDFKSRDKTYKQIYLEQPSVLFNCMWNLYPNGSLYFRKTNSFNLFDQFIISRGLLVGEQGLKMNLNSINIYTQGMTLGENLSESRFEQEDTYDERLIPFEFKQRPMAFEFDRIKNDINNSTIQENETKLRQPSGYSDHFPITCKIDIL
jgi:Endonuclease/Exonuclease/phosphatase family